MRRSTLLCLLLPLCAQAQTEAKPSWPQWMAGSWCAQRGETRIEEVWLQAAGGLMLGMSRAAGPRRTEWESLRIEWREGKLAYLAQPQGRPETVFRETERQDTALTFSNPEHDFPKTIRYWREGPRLLAEIAGPMGPSGAERAIRFDYAPCALNGG